MNYPEYNRGYEEIKITNIQRDNILKEIGPAIIYNNWPKDSIFPWDVVMIQWELYKAFAKRSDSKGILELMKGYFSWVDIVPPEYNTFHWFQTMSPFHQGDIKTFGALYYEDDNDNSTVVFYFGLESFVNLK